jgi:bifunctional DNA-binding transcriptional regulator/antitoxin component of YhaV-PrlF toxin-antitoxin module
MEYAIDKLIELQKNTDVQEIYSKLKKYKSYNLRDLNETLCKIVTTVTIHSKLHKSKRIVLPISIKEHLGISHIITITNGYSNADQISNIDDIKKKLFNTSLYDDLQPYLSTAGVDNMKKLKQILDKYKLNDIVKNGTDTEVKVQLPLTSDEIKLVAKSAHGKKFLLQIRANDYTGDIRIQSGDEGFSNFHILEDYEYDDTELIGKAICEKYKDYFIQAVDKFDIAINKRMGDYIKCKEELQHEFARYLVLEKLL